MAQYKEGRVTVTQNSDVVAGTDTRWLSNADIGDLFLVRGDEIPYRVAAVESDTSLRLNARYSGVWVRRDGRWQFLCWQSTSIPA